VTNDEYSRRWDAIFGRDLDKQAMTEEPRPPDLDPEETETDHMPTDK
jgi:hypothetical protein